MSSKTDTVTEDVVSIVKKARAGDNAAREAIIKRFHDQIFRLVFYRVKNRSDAQDITQEIFIKVLNNLSKLKNSQRLKPWVYTIAVNQVNDFHKKNKLLSFFGLAADVEKMAGDAAARPFNDKQPNASDFFPTLNGFLKTLPKNEREIFLLKYMDDLTITEIAAVLGKNESTVKTHLYRGLKKIKNHPSLEKKLFAEVYDAEQ